MGWAHPLVEGRTRFAPAAERLLVRRAARATAREQPGGPHCAPARLQALQPHARRARIEPALCVEDAHRRADAHRGVVRGHEELVRVRVRVRVRALTLT